MLRLSRRLAIMAVLGAVLSAGALPAIAADPPENIPLGSEPASCATETSVACEEWTIGRLDAARAKLGLGPYKLPAGFVGMPADRQMFILTDLDRAAYGYSTVYGLNTNLTEAARAGVQQRTDPRPPSAGGPWRGFGSVWASTGPLIAYYLWLYDDGYKSPNADCTTPSASGCWGHRHVILGEGLPLAQPVLLGAATEANRGSAMILSNNGGTSAYYTWAQAQGEGAGSEGGGGKEGGEGTAVPSIASVSPASGSAGGGTSVTISGSGLSAVKSVRFGSTPAASFTITSSSSILAVAPAGAPGIVDVTVTSAGGTSALTAGDRFMFQPVVTRITPASGTRRGGTRVTILGAGFATGASATRVTFGLATASQVSCPSSRECTALTPAHTAGQVAVRVRVNGVTSAPSAAARYTYG